MFFTFRGKYSDMTQGVGIGLSTVRSITEALQGKVSLASDIGKGTKVSFTMPLSIKKQVLSQKDLQACFSIV